MSLIRPIYRLVMKALHAIAPTILHRRARHKKEDPLRLHERLGKGYARRPTGPLMWFHGVSVGESLSLIPVIAALGKQRPDLHFLISSATPASSEILLNRLPERTLHAFIPLDTPQAVKGFLDHWTPQAAIFAESDLWPNLIEALDQRCIPRALISARITEKTATGWQRLRGLFRPLVCRFSPILAQDRESQDRLEAIGASVAGLANLKTLGDAPTDHPQERARFQSLSQWRKILLAASTHPLEEALIAEAAKIMILDGLLLIIAPRHPRRADDIRADLESLGFRIAQKSREEALVPETHIYLADTLGEMGLWLRLADVIVMGGSLTDGIGGHNPLEAARLGKAVITGSDISNWQILYKDLINAGGAFCIKDRTELTFMIENLLASPEALALAGAAALRQSQTYSGTLDRVLSALQPLLPERST